MTGGATEFPSPVLTDDELVVSLIATGLIQLSERVNRGKPFSYPYPLPLQRGLDRLTTLRLLRGQSAPQGVPDLIHWCQQPLRDWALELPHDTVGAQDRLLEGSRPTNICESWACTSVDVEADLSERQYITSALEICRAYGEPDTYVAFRRLLIEQPVMTALEFQLALSRPEFRGLSEHLRTGYQEAPTTCLDDGNYMTCGTCGNLLVRTAADRFVCENERCNIRAGHGPEPIAAEERPVWLRRSLRRFVAAPGRAELRLVHALQEWGLEVELWPLYDQYDLRILFPDGTAWAVDVKDWANPVLLAQRVRPFPREPEWVKAFFVFPDERHRERRDYVRAFRHHCRYLGSGVGAVFESQLLRYVHRQLGG